MRILSSLKISKVDALSVLVILAIVFCCYLALCHGKIMTLKNARIKAEVLEHDLAATSGTSVTLEQLEARLKASEARLATFNSMLPEGREVSDFLIQLDYAAGASGVRISRVVPENAVPKELYSEVPVDIRAEAGTPDLYRFLLSLTEMPRLTRVNEVRINNRNGEGISEIELRLIIYSSNTTPQRTG